MGLVRRCLAVLLSAAGRAGGTVLTVVAAARLPGVAWLVRSAGLCQDPAAAVALNWPVPVESPRPGSSTQSQASPAASSVVSATPAPEEAARETAAEATPAPAATPLPSAAPEIDNPGTIRAEQFGQGSGPGYITLGAGSIHNLT